MRTYGYYNFNHDLTDLEFAQWRKLNAKCQHAGSMISITKNNETEQSFDQAIDDILAFEKQHGLHLVQK